MRSSRNKPVIEESQASQILEQALDGGFGAAGSRSSNLHDRNRRKDTERDLSSDVTSSPQASRYQYFGLDATQTDTQLLDDEAHEGLQRDNKRSSPVKGMKGVQESTKASPKSTRFQHVKDSSPSKLNPPTGKTRSSPLPRGTTLPKDTNTKLSPHQASQTRRSTYPNLDGVSQDSFIGAYEDSVDPATRYIEGADQFDIPLSQLARVAEEREALLETMRRGILLRRVHTPTPPPASPPVPQGRILVDSTPSISGSQEEAMNQNRVDDYDYGQAQEPDMDIDLDGQEPSQLSSEVSAPSSSLYDYINALDAGMDTNPALDVEPSVATQPMDFTETTQAFSTPVVSQVESLPDGPIALRITKYLDQLPREEISKPAHRLLTFVDWGKLWRYEYDVRPLFELAKSLGLYQAASDAATKMLREEDEAEEAARLARAGPSHQPAYQETQPSYEDQADDPSAAQDETQPSTVEEFLPRRRGFPSRPKAFQRVPPTDSTTDNTVPDSEPLRHDTQPSPPASSAVTKSPAIQKRRIFRSVGPDFHPNSEEIVPDSVEMDNPMDIDGDATVERADDEDEDEDDDDTPLAKTTLSKGKEVRRDKKESNMPPPAVPKKPTSKAKGKQRAVSPAAVRQTRQTKPTPGYLIGSWENGVVPSSLPEQDGVAKTDATARPKVPAKAKVTRAPAKATASKVASSSKPKRETVREELSPLSDLTEDHIPNVDNGDDASTEPAYDGDEYEDPVEEDKANKKRKRRDSGSTAKSGTKAAPKRAKKTKKPETPAVRAKSLRSSAPASSSRIGGKPTRVFALWKTEAHYFLGTVHSMKPHGKYLVKFDDGTEAVVTLDQMRLAQLNVGDEVTPIGSKKKTCKVVNVDDQHNTEMVTIKLEGEDEEIKRADVTIHMKTINYAWKDRKLTSDTVVTKLKHPQPSPSRLSISSTAGPRPTSSVLSEYGIVITLSPGSTMTKDKIANVVRGGGGAVIDDWTSVLSLDGKYDRDGRRWVITQGEIAWIGNIEQTRKVFLVSDECNEKPRYLVAVALGVPCLSYGWVEACIKEDMEIEWVPHLLAQGFVEPLEANVSQFVDTLWCSTSEHLRHIMDNKVPHKILKNKTALCVGRDLIPVQGKTDVPGSHFIGQILVCMGAKRVEAVADLNDASKLATEYDIVVIKESINYRDDLDGATVVDTQWVKYSLLAGRMLPLPEWSRP